MIFRHLLKHLNITCCLKSMNIYEEPYCTIIQYKYVFNVLLFRTFLIVSLSLSYSFIFVSDNLEYYKRSMIFFPLHWSIWYMNKIYFSYFEQSLHFNTNNVYGYIYILIFKQPQISLDDIYWSARCPQISHYKCYITPTRSNPYFLRRHITAS